MLSDKRTVYILNGQHKATQKASMQLQKKTIFNNNTFYDQVIYYPTAVFADRLMSPANYTRRLSACLANVCFRSRDDRLLVCDVTTHDAKTIGQNNQLCTIDDDRVPNSLWTTVSKVLWVRPDNTD